jgi:hypothetical protein
MCFEKKWLTACAKCAIAVNGWRYKIVGDCGAVSYHPLRTLMQGRTFD